MRISTFAASWVALCLGLLGAPAGAQTDTKGFVPIAPEQTVWKDKTVALKPGSYMKHLAGAVHYDGAKDEEVIVQITGYGPSGTKEIFPGESRFGVPHKLK